MTFKGQIKVTELLHIIDDASSDQSLYEIYTEQIFYGHSEIERQIKELSFRQAIFHKPSMLWLKFTRNTHRK